ncbi:UvrD-helicase domain-containing protein [Haloarcula sp. GH36]|uniref:UvrD-helicase domain-containing protein n=1 Tax=Haloarcula montana TaxID=3111776 RepID=UPI002D78CD6B|nr:ATP-dependent DNA helicase [Haloarcula sp. GH36]
MSSDNFTQNGTQEVPAPGTWSIERFITEYEAVMRERTGREGWSFNESQQAAITAPDAPLQVTAGPGSGKSEVSVARTLKWILVDGVDPHGIVLTTYTKKAAQSLEQRLVDRLSGLGVGDTVDVSEMWVGTSHAVWDDIMREFRWEEYLDVELLDEDAQKFFIRRESDFVDYLSDGGIHSFDGLVGTRDVWYTSGSGCRKVFAANAATTLFNRVGQYCVDLDALATADDPGLRELAAAREQYEESLAEAARCDFTTVQERFIEFLESTAGQRFLEGDDERGVPPLTHVLVDEYQDVNPLQEKIYLTLAATMDEPSITVVGDDDQSLYRFRGATVDSLIEFPERVARKLSVDEDSVETVQLRSNYRSRPGIVRWINRFIGQHPVMQGPGARAPGKEPMRPVRPDTDAEAVTALTDRDEAALATRFADTVVQLHESGYIDDYSDIALLTHSTMESRSGNATLVGRCVTELRSRGVPVHNPRNKAFMDEDDVQVILASLIKCLDPGLEVFEDRVGDNLDQVHQWFATFERVVSADSDLRDTISEYAERVRRTDPGESLGFGLLELFYAIRGCDPISSWTEGAERTPMRTRRIGKVTALLESFEGVAPGTLSSREIIRTTHNDYNTASTQFLTSLYWEFCDYVTKANLDDPEDLHDQLPDGHVQVMTVHQAKGLEFPVTFVGSIDWETDAGASHWTEDTLGPYGERRATASADVRAARDLVRQFYVAHSRASEHLVLLGTRDEFDTAGGLVPSLGQQADGTAMGLDWFAPDRTVRDADDIADPSTPIGPASAGDPKREYSVVGDWLAFRRCQRQYGYLVEYDYATPQATQLFAGLVVHRTLDRAHRHFRGDLNGATAGEIPDRERLREYFDESVTALREQRILPVGAAVEDTIFEHIERFNRTVGPDLYPRVTDTEQKLRYDTRSAVLNGVVDVIVEDNAVTLCDYKAAKRPEDDDELLAEYRLQLKAYAALYRRSEGELPDEGVIYFINEDDPERERLTISFDEIDVEDALDAFDDTVGEIEATRETDSWGAIDDGDAPDQKTCAECPVNNDCDAYDP